MYLGDIIEFRKDLYFEGAVQADWFYLPEKSAKVAENFVFHGSEYYGIDNGGLGAKARIDTISLVEKLLEKLADENENALSLAIADYGTGKSHLAVTLAQLLSGKEYMPDTYQNIMTNIANIDTSAKQRIEELSAGKNFVMVINGMRDFNLHSEILKAAQKSLKLYGLPDDNLKKLNRALDTAEIFFERNKDNLLSSFENQAKKFGWSEKGASLIDKISERLMTDNVCFDIVNAVYSEVNGQEIHWDEGISAATILEMLVTEYCGMNGVFDHVVILFDEFGRYLEYASGESPAKSGDSALQQIFEMTQNADGALHVINFIQSDIKTYLQRVDQTTNISRYIGRYDASDKYYISSNLETVFANLVHRKDVNAFENCVVSWQKTNESQWKTIFDQLNRWVNTKGMWKDYDLFRKVVVEGIYPMHPISTFMLTQLSDYLQNRSSLTLISQYIEGFSEASMDDNPYIIMPEYLMLGDLYTEMLAAEQDGKQQSQQCIRYANVLRKLDDKLSDNSKKILRSNLIVRILRFRTNSYDDAKAAISLCSGLTIAEIDQELVWLENEYGALGFDEHANCFDFMEESTGAHDFKILKKRLMSQKTIDANYLMNVKIQDLAGVRDMQNTNFATKHKISTAEWVFQQELYPAENFTVNKLKSYISDWNNAKSTIAPKGRLIWLYINKDTEPSVVENIQKLSSECENKPIVLMLLNDADNRLINAMLEYKVLDEMDGDIRSKYERHFNADFEQAENNLKDEIEELKKQRTRLTVSGIENITLRMPIYLTSIFEEIYPKTVSFQFDGFVTKNNNIAPKASGYYCSIVKLLLADQINENAIHTFSIEIRNRFEAILMTTSNTSWKCIDTSYRVIPPEEVKAKEVFDLIANRIKEYKTFSCKEIFETLCAPPYGISEEVVFLMIAVVCAQLSYCLRFRVNGSVKTINNWKAEAINDKNKIDWKYILESSLVYVDGDAVSGKFSRFFDKVNANKDIFQVPVLERELKEMEEADEVPEALQTARDLAVKTLDLGKKARNSWDRAISSLEEKYESGIEEYERRAEIYNFVDALEDLMNFPFAEIFNENGYAITDEAKSRLSDIRKKLSSALDQTGDVYVENMACTAIERLKTFENHNNKLITKLKNVGYEDLARKVEKKKISELENTEEIKSRQELKADLEKFLNESIINRYTTYVQIQGYQKKARLLEERFKKYGNALGNAGKQLGEELSQRQKSLDEAEQTIRDEMLKIWDDLDEIHDENDIRALISNIQIIKQKGVSKTDMDSFIEIEEALKEVLEDIEVIIAAELNRKTFNETTSEVRTKYEEKELDFEVLDIIDAIIDSAEKEMNEKDSKWAAKYLVLENRTRENIHKWKDATSFLPEYLSDETIEEYNKLNAELEEIISEGRIDDVLYQFNKLSMKEKEECLKKLSVIFNS